MDIATTPVPLKQNWRTNNKILFKILLVSLTFNTLVILFFTVKYIYFSNALHLFGNNKTAIQNDSIVTWSYNKYKVDADRLQYFKMQPHEATDIVFIGNSLTAGFALLEMFKDFRIKNRGISGNTLKDVLQRLDEITDGKPKKIFLEIGINDICKNENLDTAFQNFVTICNTIRQNTPKTKVYIQSVLPTALTQVNNIPRIELYNEKMKAYCSQHNLTFINLYPSFLNGRSLDLSLTTDGIHLTAKGYFLWKQLLEQYVNE